MPTGSAADVAERPDVAPVAEEEIEGAVPATPPIPRHPVVVVALIGFPLLAFATFGFEAQAFVTAFTAAVLVALASIDLEHRVLPNRIVVPATGVVLVAQIALHPDRALQWPLAGLAAATFLALPLIVRRDAMGMGDLKLAVLLGAAAGWPVFGAIAIGCFAMLPAALWMLRRDGSIRDATLPFGPFLALGTLLVLYTA